jgi:predicted membrane chloride channel (bestrophin family)
MEDKIKQIDEMQVSATKERAEVELLKLHPDFVDIREDDDFHNWAEEQPKWVQQALYENDNDAKSAARAIDLYKSDRNIGKKKSTSKDAAFATNTKSSRTKPQTNDESSYLKESQVQKMSSQEYEKRADEVMEAIRTGKFVYDVSGSAR